MKSAQSSRLSDLASEVATEGYLARARERAKRRKSPWNLLDPPMWILCSGVIWWGLVHGIWVVRNVVLSQHVVAFSTVFHSQRTGLAPIVFFVAPLFASIPLGMLVSNSLLWPIPPYRRACEAEAEGCGTLALAMPRRICR